MKSHSNYSMGFLMTVLLAAAGAQAETESRVVTASKKPDVRVAVDPRVELLSIVFRIAGAEEYQRGRVPAYSRAVDAHFGPFSEHPAVERVSELRRRYWISHDAVIKLAVHVHDAVGWREVVPLEEVDTLGTRWRPAAAREFLLELSKFAEETDFAAFMAARGELFQTTADRLGEHLSAEDLLWLDGYFGAATAALAVVPGMLTGRASYGATLNGPEGPERFAIVGVEKVDEDGDPVFDEAVIETVIHELCHSYIHPVLKPRQEEVATAGEALYLSQRAKMERQAYRSGYTVINETLTRAVTHRFLRVRRSPREAEEDLAYNRSRGFLWIAEVADWLEEYEADRRRFPTLAEFFPELEKRFERLTRDLPHTIEDLAERRPKVLEVVPAIDAQSVDPGLSAIRVTFDRPMRAGSWSVVGGGPRYPETGTPSFDEGQRVFTLPVSLEPDREYELWLNRGPYQSFVSVEGVPLEPLQITFRTAPR